MLDRADERTSKPARPFRREAQILDTICWLSSRILRTGRMRGLEILGVDSYR